MLTRTNNATEGTHKKWRQSGATRIRTRVKNTLYKLASIMFNNIRNLELTEKHTKKTLEIFGKQVYWAHCIHNRERSPHERGTPFLQRPWHTSLVSMVHAIAGFISRFQNEIHSVFPIQLFFELDYKFKFKYLIFRINSKFKLID